MTNIYCLYDPRDPSMLPYYVGKGLHKRAKLHWRIFLRKGWAVNRLLRRWFEKLKAEGVEPIWCFLEENVENWQEAEKTWIAGIRVINPDLCNIMDGGNWIPMDDAARKKLASINGKLFGRIGGHRTHELHPEVARQAGLHPDSLAALNRSRTQEHQREAGRKGGYRLKELHPEVARQAGLHPDSLAALNKSRTREHQIEASAMGMHTRWHLKRAIFNPACNLCLREYAFRSDFLC